MLALLSMLFTSAAVVLSSIFFGYYALYYGVYRPTKMFIRMLWFLLYYSVMLAGLYYIVSMVIPYLPINYGQLDNQSAAETSEEKGGSNSLRTAAGNYATILFQVAKTVVGALARLVVSVTG